MKIYKAFEVVVVPFPFTDVQNSKRRPALILSTHKSFNNLVQHSIMAMVTSAKHNPWPLDIEITDLESAGLPNEAFHP